MSHLLLAVLALLGLSCSYSTVQAQQDKDAHVVEALVPEFAVQGTDQYVCFTVHLPQKPLKLTGVVV